MKNRILFFCCLLILLSCDQAPMYTSGNESAPERVEEASASLSKMDQAYPEEESTTPGKAINMAPKIIKNAEMRIEVKDLKASTRAVEVLVDSIGGRISNMNRVNYDYRQENNLTLRIPSDRFDEVIKDLGQQAVYQDYLRVSTRDVTEEFIDIETRLKTKKAVRDRYVEVLRKQAKTVEEILLAEEAIRKVQEEIESREGRLRYLRDQVGFSTIRLELYEKQEGPTPHRYTFWDRAKDSLYTGWDLIQETVLVLINFWPFVIIAILVTWVWRRRRAKKKKSA